MTIQSRRARLNNINLQNLKSSSVHMGLWFDKYLTSQPQKKERLTEEVAPQKRLLDQIHDIPEPSIYENFFKLWEHSLRSMQVAVDSFEYRTVAKPATAKCRIAIGLGDESVIETAIALHNTYGLPYLPGSALKGLTSAYAHQRLEDNRWCKKGELHQLMFGSTNQAGYITFFDALYVPGSGVKDNKGIPHALWPDVITVHHKDYYTNTDPKPPADWDSPTPIHFLTATGSYLIALAGPIAWVNAAFDILGHALQEYGVGAKTNSGYGRMTFDAGLSSAQGTLLNQQQSSTVQADRDIPKQPLALPKPGRDVIGKVVARQNKQWIIVLDEGAFEVSAHDKQCKERIEIGLRVRVRIEKSEPLSGFIKNVSAL